MLNRITDLFSQFKQRLHDWRTGVIPKGKKRSPHWFETRKAHLAKEPVCQVCGGNKKLQVHHILPFHLYPELELEQDNLITLCDPHHLLFGHLMDYHSFNPNVRDESAKMHEEIKNRPET